MNTAVVYFIIGALFILFGITSGRSNKAKVSRCTSNIIGRITDINVVIEESDTGHKKRKYYDPVFSYTVNGKTFEKDSNIISRNKDEYHIGDIAELLYNPSKPEEFIVKGKSEKSGGGFALVMVLIGAAMIVLGITQF